MPCYTTSTISVDFKPENKQILERVAKALGYALQDQAGAYFLTLPGRQAVIIRDGKATGEPSAVNGLRVSYTQEVVRVFTQAAVAKGWTTQGLAGGKLAVRANTQRKGG
jgi:hypothetical protein